MNDAQCFALIEQFDMHIEKQDGGRWWVSIPNHKGKGYFAINADLRTAIRECTAKAPT